MRRFFLLLSLLSITFFGCEVSISGPAQVSDITFDKSEVEVKQNQKIEVNITTKDNRKLNQLTWNTEPNIQNYADITYRKGDTDKFIITGKNVGSVVIKVKEEGTGKSASLNVTVKPKDVPSVITPKLNLTLTSTSLLPG